MVLRRLGNKARIAQEIIKHFPKHDIYIEPFFGAGGIFFNKPRARYNFLNDLDADVFNLFKVLTERPDELKAYFELMPVDGNLWDYWKKNKEIDSVKKAARFLFLSNFGYMGKPDTLHLVPGNPKGFAINALSAAADFLKTSRLKVSGKDFRCFLKSISFSENRSRERAFIYCDPPYLGTAHNYEAGFTEQDTRDLFKILTGLGVRFAVSEFRHPVILELAAEYNLNTIVIGERQSLKKRDIEILLTNYKSVQLSLFDHVNAAAI